MKPICLSLILYLLCSLSGHPNPPENAEAVLLEEVALQEDQQQLKAQLNEKNKKEVTLIGQVRAISIPTQKDSKVVQVVWTALQGKDKKRALFKEPLISTFKSSKGSLSKGLKISLYGNKAHLLDALTRLEKGEDDQIGEVKADNPSSNERRLEDVEGKVKKRASLKNLADLGTPIKENSSHDHTSMSTSTESYRGSSASSYGERKNADALIRKDSTNQNNLSMRRPSSSLRGGNSRGSLSSSAVSSTAPKSGLQKDKNNVFLDNKNLTTSPLNSPATSSTSSPTPLKDFEGSLDRSFDPLKINQGETSGVEEFEMPLIEVEVTREGCTPRIDLERGKVIIQTRSIAKTNGTITHETQCADSHLIFDIKKDYGCCADKVDEGSRVAYTTFRRYYLDDGYNKVYVDTECLNDESQPHPFIEEKGICSHDINLQSRFAYPQAETVYYDRSNARKVVKGCHRSEAQPLPIISTAEGCSLKHVYEQNKSLIQKKEVFIDQGVIHEIVPCHETNESIPHQFVKAGCKPSLLGSRVTRMVKRQIVHEGRKKLITNQCEPESMTELLSTREGCEGHYTHDLDAHRSYPHVKFYYLKGMTRKYLEGGCQRSYEALAHHIKIIGHTHFDHLLKSQQRYQISFKDKNKDYVLQERTEENQGSWIPYVLKGTVEKPSGTTSPSLQGHIFMAPRDKVEIWVRPDGSLFEKVIGQAGALEHALPELSPSPKPTKTVVQITQEYGQGAPHTVTRGGKKIVQMMRSVRDVTHYSDGSKSYSSWRSHTPKILDKS
ncbi:hypothetical protein IM40_10090 (plasmid) [Candidatus Paracaedimonas acanthamoebae]|nr:hypothetical protein IM40_10090 [Candidatus Paracaedimonas acanthamoebae]